MTIILVGGLIGAALALIERIVTRIRQASNATVVTTVNDIVGIRRHSTSTGVWHDTTVAGSNDPHGDTSTFFMEEHSPRHGLDDDDTDDLDQTAIIGPSSGRHSADNPNRQLVPGDVEEIRWADGTRTVRPLWMPIIGRQRISVITTNTGSFPVVSAPPSSVPWQQATRPPRTPFHLPRQLATPSGRIPPGYVRIAIPMIR